MSGTSLDGLDICLCRFTEKENGWNYSIITADTFSYSAEWIKLLRSAENCTGAELMELHARYGKFLGESVKFFLKKNNVKENPLFVASHGHTIFHNPAAGYTFQLGSGASLAEVSGIPVVCDFRSGDVALGGQGAPLVPVGDALLFGEYDHCLNLGGFANISFDENGKRIAYDICPFNYVLNFLAQREGKNFDDNGEMTSAGKVIPGLMEKLDALPYYAQRPPKSLGREWVEQNIYPFLSAEEKTADLLRTFTGHAARQIAKAIPGKGKVLVTGGGAYNLFFISLLKEKCVAEIVLPEKNLVDFKEALVFAFLGLLRWENRVNIFSSVTGASRDSCGGCIYYG